MELWCRLFKRPQQLGKLAFSIRVNYQLKEWVQEDNDRPMINHIDINKVQSTLENRYDNFYELVRQRHQRLKLLYSNYLKTLQLEKNKKVGRNDPCLCGSGKKFKKCCGAGDMLLA